MNRGHLRCLRDFISHCRQKNVQLICFTSMFYQQPPHVAATAFLIDSTLRAAGVPTLNCATQPLPRINRSARYWRDATHLNTLGVAAQSQDLARQLSRGCGRPAALWKPWPRQRPSGAASGGNSVSFRPRIYGQGPAS